MDPLTDDELNYLEQRAKNDIYRVAPAHVLSLIEEVRWLRKMTYIPWLDGPLEFLRLKHKHRNCK